MKFVGLIIHPLYWGRNEVDDKIMRDQTWIVWGAFLASSWTLRPKELEKLTCFRFICALMFCLLALFCKHILNKNKVNPMIITQNTIPIHKNSSRIRKKCTVHFSFMLISRVFSFMTNSFKVTFLIVHIEAHLIRIISRIAWNELLSWGLFRYFFIVSTFNIFLCNCAYNQQKNQYKIFHSKYKC